MCVHRDGPTVDLTAALAGATAIEEGRFKGRRDLVGHLIVPVGVTAIEDGIIGYGGAFEGCTGIVSVHLPETVTRVGLSAFDGCSSILSVNISKGCREIGNCAFYGCTSLKSVNIPQGCEHVGNFAFNSCAPLLEVTIPRTTTLGLDAFPSTCTVTRECE
jgi:hypothetical protein